MSGVRTRRSAASFADSEMKVDVSRAVIGEQKHSVKVSHAGSWSPTIFREPVPIGGVDITLPTVITLSRLCGVPFILYWLSDPTDLYRWYSCYLFCICVLTDWVDGFLARRLNMESDFGKFIDPLCDKLLVIAPLLSLVEMGIVSSWSAFVIVARELVVAGWRVSATATSAGVQGANIFGKVKAVFQFISIAILIAPLDVDLMFLGIVCYYIALVLTVVSGAIYFVPAQPKRRRPSSSRQ